jgi:hypothetical protein
MKNTKKRLIMEVHPKFHIEIKKMAAERGMSMKDFLLMIVGTYIIKERI